MAHAFAPEIPHWIGLLTDVGQVPEFGALTVATFPKSASSSHAARIGEVVNADPRTEIRGFSFCDTSIISEP